MLLKTTINRILPIRLLVGNRVNHYSNAINIEKLEEESGLEVPVIDEEAKIKEQAIEKSRNKARLNPHDYNRLHNKVPYPEAAHWSHGTLKYNQKLYGTYGQASGFNPALCWPTKEELAERIEYEEIAYPYTIPELAQRAKKSKLDLELRTQSRQDEIVKKMAKLETWKEDLKKRIAKKLTDANKAKSRKDRLVEDVRRHFGYTVDPKSDKFKELLEQKEKEQKKVLKEERRKAKEEQMLAKLSELHKQDIEKETTEK